VTDQLTDGENVWKGDVESVDVLQRGTLYSVHATVSLCLHINLPPSKIVNMT
jgi:hypothetical protein